MGGGGTVCARGGDIYIYMYIYIYICIYIYIYLYGPPAPAGPTLNKSSKNTGEKPTTKKQRKRRNNQRPRVLQKKSPKPEKLETNRKPGPTRQMPEVARLPDNPGYLVFQFKRFLVAGPSGPPYYFVVFFWLIWSFHGCRWETFYIFAYCGLVVEIQPLSCPNFFFSSPSTVNQVSVFSSVCSFWSGVLGRRPSTTSTKKNRDPGQLPAFQFGLQDVHCKALR